ncbi:zinc finger protein OZF-like isoform X2 [Corythoichthys intestinalis]|uniref:zinc finger protein OZF-like isoform X2 n=1 Tax=Corythoichthys intestinalis TaxID=161448 RepID=UPI0025A5AAB7|nr:zinc finger protein OZF-like isoform X2 [Corythoichthys intestinalis]
MTCPADFTIKELHPQKHDPLHVKQEESEMPYIKQETEPETLGIKEEKQEDQIPNCPMTVSVKSEEDEGLSEESGAEEPWSVSSLQHPTTKREGRSQPDDVTVEDLHPGKHDPSNVKQELDMQYIKLEVEPTAPSIKEEQENEIPKVQMTICVKSKEDEGPSKESRAQLASSNLFQQMTTKGEGRSQPDELLAPMLDSDDLTSHSSDFNTDEDDVDFEQNASKSLNKSSLKRNAKECAGGKPFYCSHCDKTFTTKKYLIIHTHTHTGGKSFLCTFCGKRFTHKGNLNTHIRRHTGEKPFVCSLCNKRFSAKEDLTAHTRTHTGEKPFVCTFCGKSFTQKRYLKIHTRTHTGDKPFVCSVCGKRFCTKPDLTRHRRIHTGEKPFVCSLCDKTFCTNHELTRHTRKHTGEKPFVCSLCDKRFFTKQVMTRHAQTHKAKGTPVSKN